MAEHDPTLIDSSVRVWSESPNFRRENSRVTGIPKGIDLANQLAAGAVDLESLLEMTEKTKTTIAIAFGLYTASLVRTVPAIAVIKRYLNDDRELIVGIGSFVIRKTLGQLAWQFLFEAAPQEVEKICSKTAQSRQA